MIFKELLEHNGISTVGCEVSFLTAPIRPFFLEEEYVRKVCAIAEIPEGLISEAVDYAGSLRKDPLLRTLTWHLYRLFCTLPDFKAFPDHIDITGKNTGILHLIIMLSVYPHLQLRMKLEGLPEKLADHAMTRCTSLLENRNILYPGEKGLQGRALPFMLNYKNAPCFRIGRFDYVLTGTPGNYPELFRHRQSRRYVGLCRANWRVDQENELHNYNDETVPPVGITEENNTVTGRKIDLETGKICSENITIDLAEYERLLGPGSNVLLIHIPGGGGMTMEACKASFLEARDFCKTYFPEKEFSVFGCISWAFNPAWREYLPESNLAKLQKNTLAFPTFSLSPRNGLYFVFARDDGDPATYPGDNSLRRAMIRAWNEKGSLGSAGMLLPLDEAEQFPRTLNI